MSSIMHRFGHRVELQCLQMNRVLESDLQTVLSPFGRKFAQTIVDDIELELGRC